MRYYGGKELKAEQRLRDMKVAAIFAELHAIQYDWSLNWEESC